MNRRMLGLARGIQDIPGGWVVQSRAVHIVRSGHRGEASMLSMQYVVRVDKGGQVCVCVCVCVCGWGCVGGCVCVCVCVAYTRTCQDIHGGGVVRPRAQHVVRVREAWGGAKPAAGSLGPVEADASIPCVGPLLAWPRPGCIQHGAGPNCLCGLLWGPSRPYSTSWPRRSYNICVCLFTDKPSPVGMPI